MCVSNQISLLEYRKPTLCVAGPRNESCEALSREDDIRVVAFSQSINPVWFSKSIVSAVSVMCYRVSVMPCLCSMTFQCGSTIQVKVAYFDLIC